MKKEYIKPDVEFVDFMLNDNIMVNPTPSIGDGDDDEEIV